MGTPRKYGNHNWQGTYDNWEPAKGHPALAFIGAIPIDADKLQIKLRTCPCGVTHIQVKHADGPNSGMLRRFTTYVYNLKTSSKPPPCLLEIDGID